MGGEGAGGLERGAQELGPRGLARLCRGIGGTLTQAFSPLPVCLKDLEPENPESQCPWSRAIRRPWWDHPARWYPETACSPRALLGSLTERPLWLTVRG